jgi:hypothetical protein
MQKSKIVSDREKEVRTSKKMGPAQTPTTKKDKPAKQFGGFNVSLRTPEQHKEGLSRQAEEGEPLNSEFSIFTKETSKKYKEDAFEKLSDKILELKLKDQQKHRKKHEYGKRKLQFDDPAEEQLQEALADLPIVYRNTDPQEASHNPELPTDRENTSKKESAADIIQRSIEYSQHREWVFGKSPKHLRFETQENSLAIESEMFDQGFQLQPEKPTTLSPKGKSQSKKRNSVDDLNLGPQVDPIQSAEESINCQSVTDERDVYFARKSQNSKPL